jgi:dienelactone hydrolase
MKTALVFAVCSQVMLQATVASAETPVDCHVGSYRLESGKAVDIAPSEDDTLRWRMFDGATGQLHRLQDGTWGSTSGWTDRSDGTSVSFSACEKGQISFAGQSGSRVAFHITETKFQSGSVNLAGRLVLPDGNDKVPVVVLVHGSEHDGALTFNALQRMLPAAGIGAFVYDKRGTGASGGVYTQDFDVLANDAVRAMQEARRLGATRVARVGYQGSSEGGWVAPLAASKAKVDFVIVSFGLAVSILDEDQESVALDMRFHGHSGSDTEKALNLARAGERVIETMDTQGYEQFNALREQYRSEPWFQDVHGDFVFLILPLDKPQIDAALKQFDFQTPFRYDPMPILRASTTPQLWVLGSDDLEAPSAETATRIQSLIAAGQNYTLAVYPGAEHGMTEYKLDAKGQRISTQYAPGYFQMLADFCRDGRIGTHYGKAIVSEPKKH